MGKPRPFLIFPLCFGVYGSSFTPTPAVAQGNTPFALSVKLTVVPPVTLSFLEAVTLFYQPEKNLARKPYLSSASWRMVDGGVLKPQIPWEGQLTNGRITLVSAGGDTISSELPLLFAGTEGGLL